MRSTFESDLLRNTTLGAVALWRFAASYHQKTERLYAPSLPLMMVVLPMVFHRRTVEVLADRTRDGALLKALAADRTLTAGLQSRMQSMSDRTLRSLDIAFAAALVSIDRHQGMTVLPLAVKPPFKYLDPEASRIIKAADRLGHSIAAIGLKTSLSLLSIRF
jgi:ABC-three component (ABC-3C) system Middle Component 3